MNRFEAMRRLFKERKLFKLVCGAGNEDAEEVRRLVFIYTLAGAKLFDVSANVDVVRHAVRGIDEALRYAGEKITIRPFVNVSIGMKGDPHVRKACITDKCMQCGRCIKECAREAISAGLVVDQVKCIGCGNCSSVCPADAVRYHSKDRDLKALLGQCREAGAEQIELHAAVPESQSIEQEWKLVNEVVDDNYVSICLDRLHLGDSYLRRRIKMAKDVAGDRLIVQADGVPMSGDKDDYNTTLQAVAIADIVMKSRIEAMVLLSGGTNSLTGKLATMCGVAFNGVAVGTYARGIVKEAVRGASFDAADAAVARAVVAAQALVVANIGEPVW